MDNVQFVNTTEKQHNTLTFESIDPLYQSSLLDWQPLQVYAYYRLLLSSLLLAAYFVTSNHPVLGSHSASLYVVTCLFYVTISIITLYLLHMRSSWFKKLAFWIVILDIILITALAHASGGMRSHLTILLVVAVAAGNIMLIGRAATFTAAIATLSILFEEFYFVLSKDVDFHDLSLQSGLLGIVFFATSLVAQRLSAHLRASERLAHEATRNLAEMENLNHHIIQRMQTGIVVVDHHLNLKLINTSAKKNLNIDKQHLGCHITSICPQLGTEIKAWQQDENHTPKPFKAGLTSPEVCANMARLERKRGDQVVIFLDDTSRMTQQAQQLKLASLGQLTAAIAHEVRNPLGAISHAAQLMMESSELANTDQRLAQIIQQHSLRVNVIIENILQLSRRKPAKPEAIHLEPWLKKFIDDFTLTREDTPILTIKSLQQTIKVKVDTSQLIQILTNLIENALRYSLKKNQKATAQFILGTTETELPYLEIIDQGPGVPKEMQERLFEPFFTSENDGTGLGLYICRELCEANHARLYYIPKDHRQNPTDELQGACFRITFAHPNKSVVQQ